MWHNMNNRCTNENRLDYKYYGGKGVEVCNEWMEFSSFKEWAINNGYEEGLSIDRIDGDGDYEPSNCRFITLDEQQRNKSNNINLTYKGKTQTLSEWSREYGIHERTLKSRLELGYTFAEALNKKPGQNQYSPMYKHKGQEKSLTQWANEYNIPKYLLFGRLKRGWSISRALETPVRKKKEEECLND